MALVLAGKQAEARTVLSADLPQDRIPAALAGYAELRTAAK